VNTKQRYEQDGGSCHPPAETELLTVIPFNNKCSGVCYNERMLQRTVFINKNQDAAKNAEEYYRLT
jgi:hypothetical protein